MIDCWKVSANKPRENWFCSPFLASKTSPATNNLLPKICCSLYKKLSSCTCGLQNNELLHFHKTNENLIKENFAPLLNFPPPTNDGRKNKDEKKGENETFPRGRNSIKIASSYFK